MTSKELEQITRQMRDDATIHKIFDKRDESDKEQDAKNSDDDMMATEHAAILRLQTVPGEQLAEQLKNAQEVDPNSLMTTPVLIDNIGE